ncbi:MAG: hypothetical protein QW348_06325 [Ignisphaera sp.]
MGNASSSTISLGPITIELSFLYMILYIVVAIAIVIAIYIVVGRVLRGLRVKGVISRRVEELIKIIVLVLSALIAIPIAISSFVQYSLWFSVTIVVIIIIAVIVSLRPLIENSFSYLILVSSGLLRDGEYIQVNVDDGVYEGKVVLLEGNFMEIITSDNRIVFIPYRQVLNSVIVKQSLQILKFKLYVYGHGLDIDRIINTIREILSKSRFVTSINDIRLLEVKEGEASFLVEVGLRAPGVATSCISDVYKALSKSIANRFRVEIL